MATASLQHLGSTRITSTTSFTSFTSTTSFTGITSITSSTGITRSTSFTSTTGFTSFTSFTSSTRFTRSTCSTCQTFATTTNQEATMAFDAFLKIEGIPGESLDDKHKDWIEILQFDHGLEQPASATASSSGGATAERVNHKPFVIVHQIDKASPKLAEYCCTGKHIKEINFELCRAGGDKVKYYEVKLEQAIVNKVEPTGSANDEGFPSERVHFTYGKISWTYVQQKREDGTGGGNVAAGWDLTSNKTV